ncbi:glycosyltransferase [Vibrio rotiferianus]|uniref:glycosyltransferase n=1 Tax=Vibrio rotiferianus TaxID=190895 RepID=UPI0015F7632B|nr:glycosyltransferase [Vibrio rotiferianus]
MKVASFCSYLRGGAGGSSLKLHNALLSKGIDSYLYCIDAPDDIIKGNKNIFALGAGCIRDDLVTRLPLRNDNGFNIISSGYGNQYHQELNDIYQSSDIILLRWVTDFISDYQISSWTSKAKPIIWCLSDMAPFTGGCHYSNGCNKYISDCSECNIASYNYNSHPKLTLTRRQSIWHMLTVVAPSQWIADCAAKSKIFSDFPVKIIQTGVELDIFHPLNDCENKAIDVIKKDSNKKYILFGADYQDDPRKGGKFLKSVFKKLEALRNKQQDIVIVFLGGLNHDIEFLTNCEIINVNYIADKRKLAEIYNAVDLTVLPYIEDNLPNIMLESIACGTPVVSFDVGGMPDVIVNNVNGKIVPLGDCHEMALAINEILNKPIGTDIVSGYARDHLDIDIQARKYIDLFDTLCKTEAK